MELPGERAAPANVAPRRRGAVLVSERGLFGIRGRPEARLRVGRGDGEVSQSGSQEPLLAEVHARERQQARCRVARR